MNELTAQEIQNILTFLGRVDLKGGEALALASCQMKLNTMLESMKEPVPDEKS